MTASITERRTDRLNTAATVFEKGAEIAAAGTVVATVIKIMAHKPPLGVILKGAVLAVGLKALSAVCDFKIDQAHSKD